MASYTCNSCELQFPSSNDQRQHMKSEWHRYNLKRRVAQLAPISEDVFNSKVKVLSAGNSPKEDSKQKQLTKKEIRRREKEALLERKKELLKIAHENAAKNIQKDEEEKRQKVLGVDSENFNQVDKNAQHENNTENNATDDEAAEDDVTEEQLAEKLMQEKISNRVDIPVEECLFCGKHFTDLNTNTDHMFKNHGFYIPEQNYLVDKTGLIRYISEKIGLGNICIVCNYQGRSVEAVRAHMQAKRHCKIPYEQEDEKLEISDFYDFTSSYAVAEGEGNDEDWEDVDEDEDEESYEDIPEDAIYHNGIELHLPSGVKVGHRSLMKYYRQNLKPEPEVTEGQGTVMAAETRQFLQPYDRKQVQMQKRSWQQETKNKKQHEKKGAKHVNFQPHYRDQLLQ
ncbi:REI1 (YBR267W) [Zygosaccharomyces parabailii]|nr:REI1 (YBR267W) [Zygosaccharomyces parabailii]CDH12538.1 related to Pre-60S factor REI1 [Zygosaccharomyces bailii ISA1307]